MSEEVFKLIKTLGENSFNELVKEYAKNKYQTWDVNLVNGPYDGGIDLVVRVNDVEIKKSVQITVQENGFENKLDKDLAKAAENSARYSYLKSLIFFCPYRVTKNKQNTLVREAEVNHGVDLSIIDGWKISEDCDEFPQVRRLVYKLHDINFDSVLRVSKEEKIVFDFLSTSDQSVALKKTFIDSYILSYIQDNPDVVRAQLVAGVQALIGSSVESRAINNEIGNLLTLGKIVKQGEGLRISSAEDERLKTIVAALAAQEAAVTREFEAILNHYGIAEATQEIFSLVRSMYQVSFGYELNDLNSRLDKCNQDVRGVFLELEELIKGKANIDDASLFPLVKEIVESSAKNDYFSKISASSLYVGLFQNNKLEAYIGQKTIFACLDTQILLPLLCLKFEKSFNYKDRPYQAVQKLNDCLFGAGKDIRAFTTDDYVEECVNHLWHAVTLDRFSNLSFIKDFGPSKNVFYNFYVYLNSQRPGRFKSIIEFISDILGKDVSGLGQFAFKTFSSQKLSEYFELLNINVRGHFAYDEFFAVKRNFEEFLARHPSIKRRKYAIDSDVRTANLLGQQDIFVGADGVYSEPFLVTWDSTFQVLHDAAYANSNLAKWHLYTPRRFVDRMYVMGFKIDPDNIKMNLISVIDGDFATANNFSSFLDVVATYFQKSNLEELKIVQNLALLRDMTFAAPSESEFSEDRSARSSVTDVLIEARDHYWKAHAFDDVIKVFEDQEYVGEIIGSIKAAIENANADELINKLADLIQRKKQKLSEIN